MDAAINHACCASTDYSGYSLSTLKQLVHCGSHIKHAALLRHGLIIHDSHLLIKPLKNIGSCEDRIVNHRAAALIGLRFRIQF